MNNTLKNFILLLGVCLGVPTLFIILWPYAKERSRQPVPYVMEDPSAPEKPHDPEKHGDLPLKGLYYPPILAGDEKRGELVYAREGCAQCHTQVIRPYYAGIDQFKKGWGADQEGRGLTVTRQTVMWDYLHEDYAMTGVRRLGPDLANAGYRFENNVQELYLHLYAPRARKPWSNSPAFRHLFQKRRIEGGAPSADALQLPPDLAPEEGWEIVPTSDAVALVSYLLDLKRDFPLPVAITGAAPKTLKKEEPTP